METLENIKSYLITKFKTSNNIAVIPINNTKYQIALGFYVNESLDKLNSDILEYINLNDIELEIIYDVKQHAVQRDVATIGNIKNIIAIASGKGGVGKSTVTTNLAVSLAKKGARVGILDADIYGPSQPMLLNAKNNPTTTDKKKIIPLENYNVKMMSIGNLIDPDSAIIWRGPMVSGGLMQLLHDTDWGSLDYLFIDLPPGTGDIQLTMTKKIPITGSVIVTTPQDLSLIDAKRAVSMFKKVDINVIGLVQNMTTHTCAQCGYEEAIFGMLTDHEIKQRLGIDLLGELPLDLSIRIASDKGNPLAISDNNIAKKYQSIACKLSYKISNSKIASQIDNKLKNMSIKVEHS